MQFDWRKVSGIPIRDDFDSRFVNSLGAIARLKLGPIEPGLHARYNLDAEMRELIDFTIGFNLTIPLGAEEE